MLTQGAEILAGFFFRLLAINHKLLILRKLLAHFFPFFAASLILHGLLLLLAFTTNEGNSNPTNSGSLNVNIRYIPPDHLPPPPASQSILSHTTKDNSKLSNQTPAAAPAPTSAALFDDPERYYEYSELDIPPQPQSSINPEYPLVAKENGVTGDIKVALWIDQDGALIKAQIIQSTPPRVFDKATLKAFDSIHFTPGYIAGRAVKSKVEITMKFETQK